ncbi:MAG TPA: glycine--tRNA ligase [Clostridia bacterium]|nr:glycine--tRNA ligase [Clostridia bacterium]
MNPISMEAMVNYCQQSGFVFQGSEIYGGLSNTWDDGPLGSRLKNNIKDAWRYFFIQNADNSFELDADILMNPTVWEASGHLSSFTDPLIDCKACKTRHRADNIIAAFDEEAKPDGWSQAEMLQYIQEKRVPCPKCGASDFTDIRQFNLMFATQRGVTQENAATIYLRPENAQGEYVNFLNAMRSMRAKLPFGIGQIGKAFRNEITPGNFIFRTIEFEQMEYQTFCKQGQDEGLYDHYKRRGMDFFQFLGLDASRLRFHDHEKLAHYAKAACDIEYRFPFGWGEINGTHNRTDFDLKRHQEVSGKNLTVFDEETKERYLPYVVESTYGVGRVFLALLFEALEEEALDNGETRQVLRIKPFLAPIKVNVLPLIKKRHGEKATGSIGKRYRRGDAVGTPFAVTIDDNTLERGTVTLRERDSMQQVELPLSELIQTIGKAFDLAALEA